MTSTRFTLAALATLAACGGSSSGSGTDGGAGDDVADDAAPGDDAPDDGSMGDGPSDSMPTDSMVSTCPLGQWCVETVPSGLATTLIHGVDAVDENDVFAVGDAGTILRRQAGAWSKMTSNSTKNLRGVWALSGTNVWAVGQDGAALHWDGATWSQQGTAPNLTYNAVAGLAANDVWLVGTSTAVHWTGTFSSAPVSGVPVGVAASANNNVWISSESGAMSHYTTGWATVVPKDGTNQTLGTSFYSVLVLAANDVWASTPGNGTVHFDGTTWTARASGTTLFASMYATNATSLWGVGSTKTGHWDGTSWTITTPAANTNSLYGVSGANGHVWVVGANGTILYRHD